MPCPPFECKKPGCERVHECNRSDDHTEGHMEVLATVELPAIRKMRGTLATVRPSRFRVVAYW